MKLRKMKERRNIYRDEKESFQQQLNETNEKNGALADQISQMQESSHSIRQEKAGMVCLGQLNVHSPNIPPSNPSDWITSSCVCDQMGDANQDPLARLA